VAQPSRVYPGGVSPYTQLACIAGCVRSEYTEHTASALFPSRIANTVTLLITSSSSNRIRYPFVVRSIDKDIARDMQPLTRLESHVKHSSPTTSNDRQRRRMLTHQRGTCSAVHWAIESNE
jgi:hypothetical protein